MITTRQPANIFDSTQQIIGWTSAKRKSLFFELWSHYDDPLP